MAKHCPLTNGPMLYPECMECEDRFCDLTASKTIFVDMDGTIAKFYEKSDCLERMHEPGFFKNLKHYEGVIRTIHYLHTLGLEIYIISAVHPNVWDQVVSEKRYWIEKFIPWFKSDHIIFVPVGADKAKAAAFTLGRPLSYLDVLLDDYNKNLEEWGRAGGTGVKLVNEINDKGEIGPLWQGLKIDHENPIYLNAKVLYGRITL